ncbi:MAG: ATP cone domain-containing protein, partial [Longimicrobiales bacterium]
MIQTVTQGSGSSDTGATIPERVAPRTVSIAKRDGRTVPYDRTRIAHAVEMAFRAELGVPYPDALSVTAHERVEVIAEGVERAVILPASDVVEIETIQDEVERQLMILGEHAVARRYILYREARAQRRQGKRLRLREANGAESILSGAVLRSTIAEAARGLGEGVDVERVYRETLASVYDGITRTELSRAAILAARSHIEEQPEYTYLAARLLLEQLYAEALERPVAASEMEQLYAESFPTYLRHGVACGRIDPRLLDFDALQL